MVTAPDIRTTDGIFEADASKAEALAARAKLGAVTTEASIARTISLRFISSDPFNIFS
jgi:hypothetical protein